MRDRDSGGARAHRTHTRRVVGFGVAVLMLLVAAMPALGKEAKPKPKPDLVVTAATLNGNSYTFWREKEPISVEDITKNTGTRRAGPSLTRIYLVHGGKQWLLLQRPVPALAPGKEHRDVSSSDAFAPQDYPIGAYTLRICADGKHQVDESNESNCKRLLPRHFFVIPRGWVGTMSGIETSSSITNRWQVPKAQLQFDQFEPGGVVSYLFTGTVTWSSSGTAADGCVVTGSGSRSYNDDDSIGALSVDYLHETYTASLQDTSGPPYQVTFSGCQDPPPSQPGPYEPTFWLPSVASTVALPFGSESLPGSPTQNPFGATYTWSVRAAHAL
jgi:hypothetical protein